MKDSFYTKSDIFKSEKKFFHANEIGFQQVCRKELERILSKENRKINVYLCEALLTSNVGDTKPDLLAIAEDYSYFCIIEVETSNHDLHGDVLIQMHKMTNADYALSESYLFQDLCKRNRNFKEKDKKKFHQMIESVDPEYLVVSDNYDLSWQIELSKIRVRYITISCYKNSMKEYSYNVIEGPLIQDKTILKVKWRSFYFEVISIKRTQFKSQDSIEIAYGDSKYSFTISREKSKVFLWPCEDFHNLDLTQKNLQSIRLLIQDYGIYSLEKKL